MLLSKSTGNGTSGGGSGDDVGSVRDESGEVVEGEMMEEWKFNALSQLQKVQYDYWMHVELHTDLYP